MTVNMFIASANSDKSERSREPLDATEIYNLALLCLVDKNKDDETIVHSICEPLAENIAN